MKTKNTKSKKKKTANKRTKRTEEEENMHEALFDDYMNALHYFSDMLGPDEMISGFGLFLDEKAQACKPIKPKRKSSKKKKSTK